MNTDINENKNKKSQNNGRLEFKAKKFINPHILLAKAVHSYL